MRLMRTLKVTGWAMIGLGALILAFLGYQLFVTNILASRAQDRAQESLEDHFVTAQAEIQVTDSLPPPPPLPDESQNEETSDEVEPPEEPEVLRYSEPAPEDGTPFGHMSIVKIGAEHVIFEGVDRATLKNGPGHMPWTPLPGQPGNAVISGHRTTYGAPFFDLDQLEAGDEILVETALGLHTYAVRETLIVAPTDVWVTEPRPGAWLTLTTCNPRFSARERLIIVAELIDGPNFLYALADKESVPAEAS